MNILASLLQMPQGQQHFTTFRVKTDLPIALEDIVQF